MVISLLTNTGLQFYSKEIIIETKNNRSNTLYFYEEKRNNFFDNKESIELHSVYFHQETEKFYLYKQLDHDDKGRLIETDFTTKVAINEDKVISINNINNVISTFVGHWIPVPYFNKNAFNENAFIYGPSGWARMYIKLIEKNDNSSLYSVNLIFDTTTNNEIEDRVLLNDLDSNENRNLFYLCNDTHLNMKFLNNEGKNLWVEEALKIVAKLNGRHKEESLKHLSDYLYLINFLSVNSYVPNVYLYKSNVSDCINVDLVLDIGNSRTCGLLFEDSMGFDSYNFTSVKKLQIRNLTEPNIYYEDPFAMNLTFNSAKFGAISIPNYNNVFSWASVVRLGEEAQILLNKFDVSRYGFDEPLNTISSPKRYLWDTSPSPKPWEFISLTNKELDQHERKHVVFESLTGFLSEEGKVLEKATNASSHWCKSSLMVFVFIEILNHAKSQINSYDFRSDVDGDSKKLRKLRSIVITCPTAMSEFEQFELRDSARKAVEIMSKYEQEIKKSPSLPVREEFNFRDLIANNSIQKEVNIKNNISEIEIIPRPKDIAKEDDKLDERLDWIYDEASCSQINYIYAEIAKKYSSNFKDFFEIYGKKYGESYNLTVGTLDIGGGTTDLMINKYSFDNDDIYPHLTPEPIFYETYTLAGDDLFKEVIHQLLIDGADQYDPRGYGNGQIRRYAEAKGCKNAVDKILRFFGEHSAAMGNQHRYFRKYFVKQVLVPIASKLLYYAKDGKSMQSEFTFDDVFSSNCPNESLINYINDFFGEGFNFREIVWEFSLEKVNNIIDYKFKKLFKQISFIIHNSACDIFLLAGKPVEIKHIRNLFMEEFPVSPDRIISMADYQIGTWYPFTDPKGYIIDPKTTVAVGAMIYTLAGRLKKINGFKLNTNVIKLNLTSTANYIGNYNRMTKNIDTMYLTPTKSEIEIKNISIPIFLAIKQINTINYPSKPLYQLNFNENYFKNKFISDGVPEDQLLNKIQSELSNYRNRKYDFVLSRENSVSKEEMKIESIKDSQSEQEFRDKIFTLTLIPPNFDSDYWMDEGEFRVLNFI